jgi:hypothetical protein
MNWVADKYLGSVTEFYVPKGLSEEIKKGGQWSKREAG